MVPLCDTASITALFPTFKNSIRFLSSCTCVQAQAFSSEFWGLGEAKKTILFLLSILRINLPPIFKGYPALNEATNPDGLDGSFCIYNLPLSRLTLESFSPFLKASSFMD